MEMPCPHCHGAGEVPDEGLSQHFRLAEFTRSQAAVAMDLPNVPSREVVDALRLLCDELLQPLRNRFGRIVVTSGYRSPAVNAAVGGVSTSAHLTGNAADIVPVASSIAEVMGYLATGDRDFDQAIDEGTHIHIARVSSTGLRRCQLLQKRDGRFSEWTPEVARGA